MLIKKGIVLIYRAQQSDEAVICGKADRPVENDGVESHLEMLFDFVPFDNVAQARAFLKYRVDHHFFRSDEGTTVDIRYVVLTVAENRKEEYELYKKGPWIVFTKSR